MNAGRRWAIAVPALAALVVVAGNAWTTGVANVRARDAGLEISTWNLKGGAPAPDTVAAVRDELLRAVGDNPKDAYGVELLGILATRDLDDPEALSKAVERFQEAVALRPVSPYTWANLVHAYYQLGRTGAEFEQAIRHARALGPWEAEVQATLINYGLAVRDEVSPATRGAIDLAVASAMRRNPSETLIFAERRGRLDIACAGVNWDPASNKRFAVCKEREKRP